MNKTFTSLENVLNNFIIHKSDRNICELKTNGSSFKHFLGWGQIFFGGKFTPKQGMLTFVITENTCVYETLKINQAS